MADLKGRVAVVTGASTGIGRGIAAEMAKAGATVVIAARSADKLAELATEISAAGGTAIEVPTDVTHEAQILALFETCIDKAGIPDFLINNAGIADATWLHELTAERWHQVIDTNLTSAVLCSREAILAMRKRGTGGRIINIGSLSAKSPRHHSLAYTASKFAIDGLTRQICLDYRDDLISASAIHPGATKSMLAPGSTDQMESDCLYPEQLGELVVYLCGLPMDVTMLDTVILPLRKPYFGRG
ncbi:SDR family NAD(P)-dependent oxidoreductase [Pseudoruegeria sp. HB172150]|uniref:SDR family NAD(P)-dependent oxidoreductase n=1 Tax=Pseudoruegeria sp. HB172150 TaxID=2721164 RepID=UPI001553A552|nr:SDR family oxidoreductase [Pseudoruegeria sp. HB172150]